eukprot:TRINITY_DN184_c10_g1_i1.p1 TRINITY_DN184_c10_g1~~TRINITY_DN184_c10_g1_i1.p1  ORF type:complete len:398 (-),score=133.31 TRINITY_DN184_c10_g1_i1:67-1260(-)
MSLYKTSDQLVNRHPYEDEEFSTKAEKQRREISLSYGLAGIPKYARLLVAPDITEKERLSMLKVLADLMISQERKIEALKVDLVSRLRIVCEEDMQGETRHCVIGALKVLNGLASFDPGRSELVDRKILDLSYKILKEKDDMCIIHVAKMLSNFAISLYGVRLIATANAEWESPEESLIGLIADLLVMSKDGATSEKECELLLSNESRMNILTFFSRMCGFHEGSEQCLRSNAAARVVLSVYQSFAHEAEEKRSKELNELCYRTLWNLSMRYEGKIVGRQHVRNVGWFLLHAYDQKNVEYIRLLSGTMAAMCVDVHAKKEAIEKIPEDANGQSALDALLKCFVFAQETAEGELARAIEKNSISCLQTMSRLPDAHAIIFHFAEENGIDLPEDPLADP